MSDKSLKYLFFFQIKTPNVSLVLASRLSGFVDFLIGNAKTLSSGQFVSSKNGALFEKKTK